MKKLVTVIAVAALANLGNMKAQSFLDKIDRLSDKVDRASNTAERAGNTADRAGKTGGKLIGLLGKKKKQEPVQEEETPAVEQPRKQPAKKPKK